MQVKKLRRFQKNNMSKQSNRAEEQTKSKKIWTSERVTKVTEMMRNGDDPGGHPFHEGDVSYRAANIIFEYTGDEIVELTKCAQDVVYFTNNHGVSMTDEGIQKITLRDYQIDILKMYQDNKYSCLLASRQIGKCISAQSKIEIQNHETKLTQHIPAYKLFYSLKSKKSIIEKLKEFLLDLESKLLYGEVYSLRI